MYYDDYYDEPSEFDQRIAEFKQSLIAAVKKEHQDEIERLREENATLQDVKKRMSEIESERREEKRKFESEREDMERRIKRARLSELLSDNFLQGWGAENRGEQYPKCDRCDENRYFHYTTPLGKSTSERCDCAKSFVKYEPTPVECYKFTQDNITYHGESCPRVYIYFTRKAKSDYDEFSSTSAIYDGKPFEEIASHYKLVFLDEEICRGYCEWLNQKGADQ